VFAAEGYAYYDAMRQRRRARRAATAGPEPLLWSANSDRELSTIGHKIREATQPFALALVEQDRKSAHRRIRWP
jgi:hypothetical protein